MHDPACTSVCVECSMSGSVSVSGCHLLSFQKPHRLFMSFYPLQNMKFQFHIFTLPNKLEAHKLLFKSTMFNFV